MGRKLKTVQPRVRKNKLIEKQLDSYEPSLPENRGDEFWDVNSIPAMCELLARRKDVELDARVMAISEAGALSYGHRISKEKFLEHAGDRSPRINFSKLRESGFNDSLNSSIQAGYGSSNDGLVGSDYVPLLGGPFYHQQYINGFLQATSQSFFAYHHDPIGRMIINTMVEFALGRSFRVDAKCSDEKMQKVAQALWDATAKVNDIEMMMSQAAKEIGIYGENMVWELPDSWSKIEYKLKFGQESPQAFLPRFRLIDPTVIWDIITYPEDITRVLAYQWVAPTQYQIYTHDKTSGQSVPSLKFIYQQIPASQVDHYKVNVVSDEKRGRGDLYPVLGYMKRLRDLVNYRVISAQKNAAWSIDTTIDGSQDDIDAYYADQQSLGTFAPGGSEFIHSSKIKREYLGNSGGGGSADASWEQCANMIAAATLPISYWGISTSHGMSRASSMVATEPVVKKLEMRRRVYERMLMRMFERTMNRFGIEAECEVTFPEMVVQDRSAKIADLLLVNQSDIFSRRRVSEMISKEFDVSKFDFDQEQQEIREEASLPQPMQNPLSSPGQMDNGQLDQKAETPGGTEPEAHAGMSQATAQLPAQSPKGMTHPEAPDASQRRSTRLGRGY